MSDLMSSLPPRPPVSTVPESSLFMQWLRVQSPHLLAAATSTDLTQVVTGGRPPFIISAVFKCKLVAAQ
jgi:hypothetical protein